MHNVRIPWEPAGDYSGYQNSLANRRRALNAGKGYLGAWFSCGSGMVGGKSFIDIRHLKDIYITKIREGPFSFVIDKISRPLPAGIYDIELRVFPGLKHPRGVDHGTGCHGGI